MAIKNYSIKLSILMTIFIVMSLSGCLSHWQGDLAKIVISFGGAGRADYNPNDKETHLRLENKVVLKSATETLTFDSTGITFVAYVAPGKWNISVLSYLDEKIYAIGSEDVILKSGDNTVKMPMYQAIEVTFDPNGGSGNVPQPIPAKIGGNITMPSGSGLSRTGYIFGGWCVNADGTGQRYNAGSTFSFTDSITLYARWVETINDPGADLAAKLNWLTSNAVNGESYIVTVNKDENLAPQSLSYDGKTVSITLKGDAQTRTVNLSGNGSLFTINSGVTLILDGNITLKGRASNNAQLIKINSGGMLEMKTGSKITGNTTSEFQAGVCIEEGAIFTMNGGEISGNTAEGCGGVQVEGTFTMNGGTISGNKAINNSGGGVWVTETGNFTMSGGEISNNTAYMEGGGVHMYKDGGTFTMSGGKISGNKAKGSGGGVCVHEGGNFTMSGNAVITGNAVTTDDEDSGWGSGGVQVYENATFKMNGGTISNNTAKSGGGVNVNGTFTMEDGKIHDNEAVKYGGGGVQVGETGTFTMKKGEIHKNKAASGGGVYVWRGTFYMEEWEVAKIYGNTAKYGGGGVEVGETGTFNMSGGEISGNTAGGGGGVYLGNSGTFTMDGGKISGNTAADNGGGVKVISGGTFNKKGGTITGYADDTDTGNVVKESGVVRDNRGHAVVVEDADDYSMLYRRETTAGSNINLFYDGTTSPPTVGGDWVKEPNSYIIVVYMEEWELLENTKQVSVNGSLSFVIENKYTVIQWYLDGEPVGNSSTYNFSKQTAGIYEIAVLVENNAKEKRSGSCQVIVR